MQRTIPRQIVLSIALGLLAVPGVGSPGDPIGTVPLFLRAVEPELKPMEGGPYLVPTIPGYGTTSRPGEPALPIKVLLVAIPEGSVPELHVLESTTEILEDLDLAPVPRVRVPDRHGHARGVLRMGRGSDRAGTEAGQRVQEYEPDLWFDPRIFGRDDEFPTAPLRLGSIGYLRHQRFVEVIFTPLLYNPGQRRAHLFRDVRAEVRFSLPDGWAAGRPFRPDPHFEATYRASLFNYEQGKEFRIEGKGDAAEEAVPLSTATGVEAARVEGQAMSGLPRYKIHLSEAGVYRLDHAYLTFNAPGLLGADPGTWVLEAEGVEVPISIRDPTGGSGEADGTFDSGDYLEFYGRPKGEPPAVLNHDFGGFFPDIYQANDFTDTQIYWLSSVEPAGSHLRVPTVSGAPTMPGFPLATDFEETVTWDENDLFLPLADADPYFSLPSLLADSVADQRDIMLALPGIAPAAVDATVEVRLRGGTNRVEDPDHRTQVWVNDDTAGMTDFTWDGEVIQEQAFTVSQTILTDPSTVHFMAPGISGVSTDRQYIDRFRVTYRRTFEAIGAVLTFSHPNQDARFQVIGLSAQAPVIYEIGRSVPGSGEADPVLITGAVPSGAPTSTYTFEVAEDTSPGAPSIRTFVVAGLSAWMLPDATTLAPDPVLTTPGNAADFLVIAHRDTIDDAPGGSLDLLLAHRLATQGLTSRVVFIDQIYDEFSYGLRDVNAIRTFLDYTFDNWQGPGDTAPPPSYVLLVGDATPDSKNSLNRPDWVDQVPTPIMFQLSSILGYYSSDNYLASFRGADQIPDVHLGRISSRTAAESAAVFDKIRVYETSPPAGLWKGRAVLAASDGKSAPEAASFEAVNDDLAAVYFSVAPYSTPSPPLYYARAPWNSSDPTGYNTDLMTELDLGAAVFVYVGHGNFSTYGLDTLMTNQDAALLANGSALPFMLNINCLAGGFHYFLPEGSIGEVMINNPNGGAIAAVAPSGLSHTFVGSVVASELFEPLFGPVQGRSPGPAASGMRAALWNRGSIVDLQSYTFLGDPATVLATPSPPPPTGLGAVAANGEVALSWVAPAAPVDGYRIYRAAFDPAAPYNPITCDPTSATSCVDLTVLNATRYYYYAVSTDADGFGGRASNLNSDCDVGPDCVTALPLNPGPPSAPIGLAADDPGSGGRLQISWDPHPETDIDRLTLYYGIESGVYTASAEADAETISFTLNGLTDGVRYYMALSATNTSGHESVLSEEVSAVPHLIQGIAPPRAISDLRLSISGPDVILTWSRPLVDIYGRPTTVLEYKVYRGTIPEFQPSPATLIATISDGAITTLTDAGAAVDPAPAYYLVSGRDAGGFISGIGRELPNGVGDLQVTALSPDLVRLVWSAVTTEVQGLPTLVDHYQVHRSGTPIGRVDLDATTLIMDNVTALSVDLSLPTSPQFLSVIAVDNRGNLSPF